MIKFYTMAKKTVPVKPHKRSTPSPIPRKNPDSPKPGRKQSQLTHINSHDQKNKKNANAQQPHTLPSRTSPSVSISSWKE